MSISDTSAGNSYPSFNPIWNTMMSPIALAMFTSCQQSQSGWGFRPMTKSEPSIFDYAISMDCYDWSPSYSSEFHWRRNMSYTTTTSGSFLDYPKEQILDLAPGSVIRIRAAKPKPAFPGTPKFFRLGSDVYTADKNGDLILHASFKSFPAAIEYIAGDKS